MERRCWRLMMVNNNLVRAIRSAFVRPSRSNRHRDEGTRYLLVRGKQRFCTLR